MSIRTERTRAVLMEALLACLQEKPIRDISAADISSRAGVDRATFYRHFGSVDDIVTALEKDQLNDFRKLMEAKDLFGEDLIRSILDQIDKGKKINQTAMIAYFSESFTAELAQLAKEYAFDAWQKRMPRASSQEVELALTTVISAVIQVVRQEDRYNRDIIVKYISNMVNGIVSMYS